MDNNMIYSILPYKEKYSSDAAGAIALTVENFTKSTQHISDITVITGSTPTNPLTEKYIVCNYKTLPIFSKTKKYCSEIAKLAKNHPGAILEIHNRPSYVKIIRNTCKNKIILYLHNDPNEIEHLQTLESRKMIISLCDHIICVSNYIKNELLKDIEDKELSLKVSTVYNINIKEYKKKEKIKQIIFVGRLTKEKGIIELCEALHQFLPDNPDWSALFIAHHSNIASDDKSPQVLEHLVKSYPTQTRHISRCSNLEVLEHFSESSVAVLPSKWNEPFGLTVLEAMNAGCAIITSNRGGIPEIVGDCGILMNEIKSNEILFNLKNLHSNPMQLLKLQKRAHERSFEFKMLKPEDKLAAIRKKILS